MLDNFLPNHPVFVHFPMALLAAALFFECLGLVLRRDALHDYGRACLYLGTAAALVAVATGLWGEGLVTPRPRALQALIDRHKTLAFVSVCMAAILTMWRIEMRKHYHGRSRVVFAIALAALVAAILFTGHLGGRMVYDHGAAVTLGRRTFGSKGLPRESWPPADSAAAPGAPAPARP